MDWKVLFRYKLMISPVLLKKNNFNSKNFKRKLPTVFFNSNSPLGTTTPTLSRLEFFPQKTPSVENQHKCIQLSTVICLSLIVKVSTWVLKQKPNCCWWRLFNFSITIVSINSLWLSKKKDITFLHWMVQLASAM